MTLRHLSAPFAALLVAACSSPTIKEPSSAHMMSDKAAASTAGAPLPVTQNLAAPKPRPVPKTETYSVVVNNVKVHDLLFALARDARLNVDIHPGISGYVTLNAIDQTLPQLLNRISRQVDMRFEIDGPNLAVMPDTPFLRNYPIDYVNMSRDTTGTVSVTSQLAGVTASGTSSTASGTNNNSTTKIDNKAQNRFWETLVQNIKDILRETDKILPEGSSETVVEQAGAQSTTGTGAPQAGTPARNAQGSPSLATSPNPASMQTAGTTVVKRTTFREAASVIAHAETGIITVRATSRQHEKIQEFLDKVQSSARRQVMIEATVVEVLLSNQYQQGIDWTRIATGAGWGLTIAGSAINAASTVGGNTGGLTTLTYNSDSVTGAIRLLDTFGTTKVLSSPKISVLNNQTAILKVVDNSVYFTIKADTSQNQTTTVTTYTTTLNQVPVGFVMNVTPQISAEGQILLNVRPNISRIVGTVDDPNPALKIAGVTSPVPVIRTREMESVLRVQNGSIAVMGGLMEDTVQNKDSAVPGIGQIPLLGELFTQRNDIAVKSELVIFIRPTVIRDPSVAGDYSGLRGFMPKEDFFTNVPDPQAPGDKFSPPRSYRQ